jgi:hypothetical protein
MAPFNRSAPQGESGKLPFPGSGFSQPEQEFHISVAAAQGRFHFAEE